jgi:hypothetical protein
VKEEIGENPLSGAHLYKAPLKLRKRKEQLENISGYEKPIQPNEFVVLSSIFSNYLNY